MALAWSSRRLLKAMLEVLVVQYCVKKMFGTWRRTSPWRTSELSPLFCTEALGGLCSEFICNIASHIPQYGNSFLYWGLSMNRSITRSPGNQAMWHCDVTSGFFPEEEQAALCLISCGGSPPQESYSASGFSPKEVGLAALPPSWLSAWGRCPLSIAPLTPLSKRNGYNK